MRFTAIFSLLLLAPATAYLPIAPPKTVAARSPLFRSEAVLKASVVAESSALNDVSKNVSEKIQAVLEKADELVLSRAMRFVNHAPVIVTLATMINKLGSSRFGLDIAPSSLMFPSVAGLTVPGWVGYCLPVLVVSQVAAVARSALADNDELSQTDISALAVSNFAMTRALTDASPLNWALTAIASGYSARNGQGSDDTSIRNLSVQITSSVSTAAAVLGVISKLPAMIPFLRGQEEATALLGLAAMLGLTVQDGNGKVKRVVNAAILGGVFVSKLAAGAFNLSMSNLISKGMVVTLASAYVAAVAVSRAQDALN